MRFAIRICFLLLLAGAVLPAGAQEKRAKPRKKNADITQIGQRDINKGSWNLWSPEREIELGMQMATETERTLWLLRDPVVVGYVSDLAERIVRNSDARMPVQVRVVDAQEINAFALPGGHFFVTTGLIRAAETEAELASVIAHEVAHLAARHATKQMTRATIWSWLSIPLMILGGPTAYAIQQGATLAVPLTFLKFSRNAEREADFLGLQYHYAGGYDPVAFVDFFERLRQEEQSKKGGIAKVFSTHPMTGDRIVAAERTIENYLPERQEYVVTTSRHDEVREYLARLESVRRRGETYEPVLHRRSDRRASEKQKGKSREPF